MVQVNHSQDLSISTGMWNEIVSDNESSEAIIVISDEPFQSFKGTTINSVSCKEVVIEESDPFAVKYISSSS